MVDETKIIERKVSHSATLTTQFPTGRHSRLEYLIPLQSAVLANPWQ